MSNDINLDNHDNGSEESTVLLTDDSLSTLSNQSHEEINIEEEEVNSEITETYVSFTEVATSITKMAFPTALSYTFSIQVFLTIVLAMYISEDETDRAATTIIATMMNAVIALSLSPLIAMSLVSSKKLGALNEIISKNADQEIIDKKRKSIADIYRSGLTLGAITTPPVALTFYFSSPILQTLLGQQEQEAEIAQDFLRILILALPAYVARFAAEQMMLSFNKSKEAMAIGLVNLALGAGASVLLGVSTLILPQQNLNMVAVGFILEAYATAIGYTLFLKLNKDLGEFNFLSAKDLSSFVSKIGKILKIGGSITFTVATEMMIGLALGMVSGLIGRKEQSDIGLIMQYSSLSFLFSSAFTQCNAQLFGQSLGAKQYVNASRYGQGGLITSMMYLSIPPLMLMVKPQILLLTMPKNKREMSDLFNHLTRIMMAGVLPDAIRGNLLQQLRMLGDIKTPTYISIVSLSGGMIIGSVLGVKTDLGAYALGAGYSGGVLLATSTLFIRYARNSSSAKIQRQLEAPVQKSSSCFALLFNDNLLERLATRRKPALIPMSAPPRHRV